MPFPKTVVLVPSYNRQETIGHVLASLLASEGGLGAISSVYLADDCSEDRTIAVARETWKSAVPLKVIERPENLGERGNVNDAMRRIAAEEGAEWVLMIYSDDAVKPAWLKEVAARISRCSPGVGSICTSWDYLWDGRTVPGENDRTEEFRLIGGGAKAVRSTLLQGCWWHVSCCAIRFEAYRQSGDFEPLLRHNGDWEWLLKCLEKGWAVEYIPRALHYYRQHAHSVSSGSFRENRDILDGLYVYRKYARYLSPADLARVHAMNVYFLARRSAKPLLRADWAQVVRNVKTGSLCFVNLFRCLRWGDVLVEGLATVGFIGRIPKGAGTAMSAVVCALAYYFPEPRWIEGVCLLSTAAGLAVAAPAVRVLRSKDPKTFVLDELAGMTLTLAFLPITPWSLSLGFVFFRFFDILKPLGVRRLDAIKHPSGIVWDDLLAGFYAHLALRAVLFFL